MEQFDGDYDILLSTLLEVDLFREDLVHAFALQNGITKNESQNHFESLIEEYPLLNISVPIHCEEWDVKNFIPPVIPIPVDLDEKKNMIFKGFYSNNKTQAFSSFVIPEIPVIAIGINERGGEPIDQRHETSLTNLRARTDGAQLKLWQINIPDLNAIEVWINGKPEFRFRVFSSQGNSVYDSGTPAGIFKPNRSEVDDPGSWYVMNVSILASWTFANQGNTLAMHWIEVDGGTTDVEITESFTIKDANGNSVTSTYTFDRRNHDDDLGNVTINNTDPTWALYETATIRWYM